MTPRPLYHSHAWAYDAVVAPPAEAETAAVVDLLTAHEARSVLDAGCGSGRFAAALAARFDVTGLDRSAELVAVARERVPGARFEVGDLGVWRPAAPLDAALCRGVLNDCIDDAERGAAVAGLRGALRPGGVLVVDVRDWDGSVRHYRARPAFERRAETERGLVEFRSVTELDHERRMLLVRERLAVDGRGDDNSFEMRPWTRAELEAALLAAGFAGVDFDALPPRREDRIVAVAR